MLASSRAAIRTAAAMPCTTVKWETSRFYSSSKASLERGMMDELKAWIGRYGRKTTIGSAKALFNNCHLQSTHPFWHTRGLIGTDFRSRHMVLVLHIWMIHKRLMAEGKPGLLVQEALFDELWEDTSNRIRSQGVGEMSVNKYLKEVQGYSFRCCVELDHVLSLPPSASSATAPAAVTSSTATHDAAVAEPDQVQYVSHEERVVDEIAGALWRGVYLKKDDVAEDVVLALAQYVRREQLSLLELPSQAVLEGRFAWGKPPAWTKPSTRTHTPEEEEQQQERKAKLMESIKEHGVWREAVAPDGRKYYWNTKTRESRWDKPV